MWKVGTGDLLSGKTVTGFKVSQDVCHLLVCQQAVLLTVPNRIHQSPYVNAISCIAPAVLVATLEKQENIANEKCN